MADELVASSACPICGQDTPHYHNREAWEASQVRERVWRPAFEQWLSVALDGTLSPHIVPRHERFAVLHRITASQPDGDERQEYRHPGVQSLWLTWRRGAETVSQYSNREPKE